MSHLICNTVWQKILSYLESCKLCDYYYLLRIVRIIPIFYYTNLEKSYAEAVCMSNMTFIFEQKKCCICLENVKEYDKCSNDKCTDGIVCLICIDKMTIKQKRKCSICTLKTTFLQEKCSICRRLEIDGLKIWTFRYPKKPSPFKLTDFEFHKNLKEIENKPLENKPLENNTIVECSNEEINYPYYLEVSYPTKNKKGKNKKGKNKKGKKGKNKKGKKGKNKKGKNSQRILRKKKWKIDRNKNRFTKNYWKRNNLSEDFNYNRTTFITGTERNYSYTFGSSYGEDREYQRNIYKYWKSNNYPLIGRSIKKFNRKTFFNSHYIFTEGLFLYLKECNIPSSFEEEEESDPYRIMRNGDWFEGTEDEYGSYREWANEQDDYCNYQDWQQYLVDNDFKNKTLFYMKKGRNGYSLFIN